MVNRIAECGVVRNAEVKIQGCEHVEDREDREDRECEIRCRLNLFEMVCFCILDPAGHLASGIMHQVIHTIL
jgi:hypothetical protein